VAANSISRPPGMRRWIIATMVVVAIIAAVVAVVAVGLSLRKSHRSQVAATGQYQVCFVTTSRDKTIAEPAWQAVQAANNGVVVKTTRVVISANSSTKVESEATTAIEAGCALAVTVGADLHDAVGSIAAGHQGQQFLNVGSTVSLPNVHNLQASPLPTAEITQYVQQSAQQHYGGIPPPPGLSSAAPKS
jgi:basic membrane lipoprotein Med (substrate-binding protein (PBP1-ABC) superfamily)